MTNIGSAPLALFIAIAAKRKRISRHRFFHGRRSIGVLQHRCLFSDQILRLRAQNDNCSPAMFDWLSATATKPMTLRLSSEITGQVA
jgi:hypothetical protein